MIQDSRCSCCGNEDAMYMVCPDCQKLFSVRCITVHRQKAHGYMPGPEEEYRNKYLYRFDLLA